LKICIIAGEFCGPQNSAKFRIICFFGNLKVLFLIKAWFWGGLKKVNKVPKCFKINEIFFLKCPLSIIKMISIFWGVQKYNLCAMKKFALLGLRKILMFGP
jgi:hypothetical protein